MPSLKDLIVDKRATRRLVVETTCGKVAGACSGGVAVFRGVPFAAPPVGERRFAPPAPPIPWQGELDCTRFRDSAVQASELVPGVSYSEDCLYLNIWAPEDTAGQSLPVLVFIHGGGFSDGTPANPIYTGTRFARHGVIQVNVTYRLGALGFMPFEEIAAQYGNWGNCGLLDQIAALKWVRDNIAAFGGDASRVTICGESAGSFSVSSLILSPLAKGLFWRAIMESGNILGQPVIAPTACGELEQAVVMARAYAASLGARGLAEMRGLEAKPIAAGSAFKDDITRPNPYCFFPVFDGAVLPKDPYKALLSGQLNPVDVLAGFNTDEGSIFAPGRATEEDYIRLCRLTFNEAARPVLDRYPVDAQHTAEARVRALAKIGLRFGSDLFADELSRQGRQVYYYNFNFRPKIFDRVGLGAMHALELLFAFDTAPRLSVRGEGNLQFQRQVHGRWLAFVRGKAPNVKSGPLWPRYTPEEKQALRLDEVCQVIPTPDTDDVAFYRNIVWGAAQ